MKTTKIDLIEPSEGDLVLREIWRIKDAQSTARGHSIDRLFTEARDRQKRSGHPVVSLRRPPKKLAAQKP